MGILFPEEFLAKDLSAATSFHCKTVKIWTQ